MERELNQVIRQKITDALAEAMQTGQPYQTRLDPPPADPRGCHPPKSI